MLKMWRLFRVVLLTYFSITSAIASPVPSSVVQITTVVPIVNICNDIPLLFEKHWQFRNTFGVIIEQGTAVRFELQNQVSLGDGSFFISCLHNTKDSHMRLKFSKNTTSAYEMIMQTTCVPTVGVLMLCNSPPENVLVNLISTNNTEFQPLPYIEFKSFETYDYNNSNAEEFLNQIQSYGFVRTPRAQVLIGKIDVEHLQKDNLFMDGLKVMNDVVEKCREYSGRSVIPFAKGPRVNSNLEKEVMLLKAEDCVGIRDTQNINIGNQNCRTHFKSNNFKADNETYQNYCGGVIASNVFDRIKFIGKSIWNFFTADAKNFTLIHEISHHFDIFFEDLHIDVQEVWVDLYVAFYQSRFIYDNDAEYWLQQNGDRRGDAKDVQKQYESGTLLQMPLSGRGTRHRTHFLMALFTVDNHDASVFRSYNIRAMSDNQTRYNILQTIAVLIKDQYNINVVPFIQPVTKKNIPWLNLTNIYDLAESHNFRMPCFYYPDQASSLTPKYRYVEHYLKPATNLHLCTTTMDTEKQIEITIENAELMNKSIKLNSLELNLTEKSIVMNSRDTAFVVWAELNKTAVALPTYTFCSPKQEYKCKVSLEVLTYDDNNPSQLFSPFRFDILAFDQFTYDNSSLIASLFIDIKNKMMMINRITYNAHVTMEIYNSSNELTNAFSIDSVRNGKTFTIDMNYTFKFLTAEKKLVKILDYSLEDLDTDTFVINEFGITELHGKNISYKIRDRFIERLSNDMKYKPHLSQYQHLTDLLRILQTAGEN